MFGVTTIHPVPNPPSAGILAVGAISERPVARHGQVEIGHVMRVSLACDHRVLDRADARSASHG
jgi:pyruvate dehydrogenase E2 component (dihydrolipoamide acetyltransferase)